MNGDLQGVKQEGAVVRFISLRRRLSGGPEQNQKKSEFKTADVQI
jgi:hypothetical protein